MAPRYAASTITRSVTDRTLGACRLVARERAVTGRQAVGAIPHKLMQGLARDHNRILHASRDFGKGGAHAVH